MKSAGELDVDEESNVQMRAVLLQIKIERCHSAAGPNSLSAGENHSFPVLLSLMFCLVFVLSCLSCFLYIYKHNYGAIVLAGRDVMKFQDCKYCFGPKYIFRIVSLAISSTNEYTFRPHQTVPGHYHS